MTKRCHIVLRKETAMSLLPDLRQLFRYEPDTGAITWAVSRGRAAAGSRADYIKSNGGYLQVQVFKGRITAHKLAWLLTYGKQPAGEIDHINGVRHDNRLSNLRDVSRATNNENQRRPKRNNKDGVYLGVSYFKCARKFRARIKVNGVDMHLGLFACREEAAAAYADAKRRLHVGAIHGA